MKSHSSPMILIIKIIRIIGYVCCMISLPLSAHALTLRDKIGQMLILGFDGSSVNRTSSIVKVIDQDNLGGVVLFDYDGITDKYGKNIQSRKQVRKLTRQLQFYTRQAERKHHRPLLPLLIAVDNEGGEVDRLKTAEGFEPALSAALLPKLSAQKASHEFKKISSNLKSAGFNLDFAPVLDVNVNPKNPVIAMKNRSFSADPMIVSHYAGEFSRSLHAQGIACTYKHFPGHGSSEKDSHIAFVDVSQSWKPYELQPYEQLFAEKWSCPMVMTAHIVNRQLDPSGLPATLSYPILTKLLREKMHFLGVVISDDMQMDAIEKFYTLDKAVVLAINAGVDMLLFDNQIENPMLDPKPLIDLIEAKVKSGEISEARIDEAYQRIVRLKKQL